MIRSRSSADILPNRMLSFALAAALATGFVAGQLTPDIAGIFTHRGAVHSLVQPGPSLVPADDYGIRHQRIAPLTQQDDYANRHASSAAEAVLTPGDDYANRH